MSKEKEYTFYIDDRNDGKKQSKFVFCQRPCDSNMSLRCFTENGEILGYMSESLAKEKGLKEIDLNTFLYYFVRPIIKENFDLKQKVEDYEHPKGFFKRR